MIVSLDTLQNLLHLPQKLQYLFAISLSDHLPQHLSDQFMVFEKQAILFNLGSD